MQGKFKVHTIDSAPDGAQPMLQKVEKGMGQIPNILRVMATSPAALEGYLALSGIFNGKAQFTPVEAHVILQTINHESGCDYCMTAHAVMAVGSHAVSAELDSLLRDGKPLTDARLEALRLFTAAMVSKRGWIETSDLDVFLAAGFTQAHVLGDILGIGLKVISNYTNHVAQTPLDDSFAGAFRKLTASKSAAE